ncbi:Protein of unknown function [Cotesia congregata]|uniref:Uncharacterized protein n=1 Tax=Cotesia congregata TaxID=51543 RepID=A0A8J2HB82_COTCN|nr:Protein of unknown function [Cotesia congregata]
MPKRKCRFNNDYTRQWSFVKKGRNDYEAYCCICSRYIAVSHSGKSSIRDHVKTRRHQSFTVSEDNPKHVAINTPKEKFLIDNENDLISAAELTTAYKIVRHHQSFKSLDCNTKLSVLMYPDSNIAARQSAARTKATAIIKRILAPHSIQQIQHDLDHDVQFCGIMTDSSCYKSDVQPAPDVVFLKNFFENPLAELYIVFLSTQLMMMQRQIRRIEQSKMTIVEVKRQLGEVRLRLTERKKNKVYGKRTKQVYRKLRRLAGFEEEIKVFDNEVESFFETAVNYLDDWLRPLEKYEIFMWMDLDKAPNVEEVARTVGYLSERGVEVSDEYESEVACLRGFVEKMAGVAHWTSSKRLGDLILIKILTSKS